MSKSSVIEGVDYGPLAGLVGLWKGDKGLDKAPEPGDGAESATEYYETINYEAIGNATNARTQTLAVLRYHQVVSRKKDDQVFHNETGYWSWDAATNLIMKSLTIPRGVALLAGGNAKQIDDELFIEVKAADGDKDWGIVQSPFMRDNARTVSFRHSITLDGAGGMAYEESTMLDIYSKQYDHIDQNALQKV